MDDRASLSGLHGRQDRACPEEGTQRVDPHEPLEDLGRGVLDRTEMEDGGVVDEHVDPLMHGERLLDEMRPGLLRGHVQGMEARGGAEGLGRLASRVLEDVSDHHEGARLDEALRDRRANAARCTRDEGDTSFELEHGAPPDRSPGRSGAITRIPGRSAGGGDEASNPSLLPPRARAPWASGSVRVRSPRAVVSRPGSTYAHGPES